MEQPRDIDSSLVPWRLLLLSIKPGFQREQQSRKWNPGHILVTAHALTVIFRLPDSRRVITNELLGGCCIMAGSQVFLYLYEPAGSCEPSVNP